ncbi:Peptidyl-tRNA hydrolase ICT1, mitochondrial [Galemys pyrenaicus]|uniref:Large ribosomal subunit protein mL62 n=1 Tax=Galemys pyrenaicus TaxID=202257 RepID=A0A8J5ZTN1_GALPY|nr:Peptidyl-tRNA hydrolase ICT1, mitochondrial [Galemys pyrenaicus]
MELSTGAILSKIRLEPRLLRAGAKISAEPKFGGKHALADRRRKCSRKQPDTENGGRPLRALGSVPSRNLAAPAALAPPDSAQARRRHGVSDLDKLYPESRGRDTAWKVPVSREGWTEGAFLCRVWVTSEIRAPLAGLGDDARKASSDIPLDRLTISYCRSSGPGGQNVNKVNSKAEVRFHLATADWITEPVRQKMAVTHKNKINRSGELILTSECSRYQFRNLADCLQKIRDMIAEASQPAKEPSREDAALHRMRYQIVPRVENMNRERLRQKRINAAIKTSRRAEMD